MQKKLVILPYKQEGIQGNELKLALKCWKKFCTFDYHFIVIGDFNESLKIEFPWVEFIFTESISRNRLQYTAHLDIQNKFKIVKDIYSNIYDGFIWMVDDNYAIKQFDFNDIITTHYHQLSFTGTENKPPYFWSRDKWKTKQLLNKENLPHIDYTTHFPCYFEFKKLNTIWKKFNMLEESYVLEDIYFNYFEHKDLVLDKEIRLSVWSKKIYDDEFQNAVNNPNIKFICNSVNGWSKELEHSLEDIILR